ncbi:MAG: hypothetical protein IJ094_02375 [Bacilli bacterium]|nr:hypothetical protein [Bacilli bacterium]
MIFSEETQKRIHDLFGNDPDFANRLLKGDVDAIRELTSNNSMDPMCVIDAIESNEIDKLYDKAKFKLGQKQLYHQMSKEYSVIMASKIAYKKK